MLLAIVDIEHWTLNLEPPVATTLNFEPPLVGEFERRIR
jgi:hypothetical protein